MESKIALEEHYSTELNNKDRDTKGEESRDIEKRSFNPELCLREMDRQERMEPIPSNGAGLVRLNPRELVDEAPLGSIQITVFVTMLVAGIFQGYDNQALAYTATDFAKTLGMTPAALAVAFSAGLFGMMVGALLFGQLADRIGRRAAFLGAISIMGAFILVMPLAKSILALSMFRFISGLGMGGIPAVIPSFISEFAPARVRNSFGAWALSGIPVGGVLGGVIAASVAPVSGWKSVYLVGGVVTALLAALAFIILPESPLFLLSHKENEPEALDVLQRINGTRTLPGIVRAQTDTKKTTSAVHGLFGDGRWLMTVLFWLITGVLLMGFYFMVNWAPTLLLRGGFSAKIADLGSAFLNIGGAVLGFGIGWFSDHWGGRRVMSAIFIAGGLSMALAGVASGSSALLMVTIVVAGSAWIAGQAAMVMLVARSYPDEIRTTGVGWALTAGFVGAMISPAIVAIPLGHGWTPAHIMLLPVIPALVCAVGIFYAAPLAVGNKTTNPQPAVKTTTVLGE